MRAAHGHPLPGSEQTGRRFEDFTHTLAGILEENKEEVRGAHRQLLLSSKKIRGGSRITHTRSLQGLVMAKMNPRS